MVCHMGTHIVTEKIYSFFLKIKKNTCDIEERTLKLIYYSPISSASYVEHEVRKIERG
jgi:hypothetical protein